MLKSNSRATQISSAVWVANDDMVEPMPPQPNKPAEPAVADRALLEVNEDDPSR